MTLTDKTVAPITVAGGAARFTVAVDGKVVGHTEYADRGGQRVFFHTEVDEAYGGRGLATALIGEALAATRAEGKRIVPVCSMVSGYVKKHHDFDDIVDKPTPNVLNSLPGR